MNITASEAETFYDVCNWVNHFYHELHPNINSRDLPQLAVKLTETFETLYPDPTAWDELDYFETLDAWCGIEVPKALELLKEYHL